MPNIKIVEEVYKKHLKEINERDVLIYSDSEAAFLKKYAPHAFCEEFPSYFELIQMIFDICVKIDISAQNAPNLYNLVEKKTTKMNSILYYLERNQIFMENYDIFSDLCQIKTTSLDILENYKKRTLYENQKEIISRPYYRGINTDEETLKKFGKLRDNVCEFLDDESIPIIIYGSAVYSSTPDDIDLLVFPSEITSDFYQRILSKKISYNGIPVSFNIVPRNYITSFVLYDRGYITDTEKSIMINGKIKISKVLDKEYLNNLRLTEVAQSYIESRKSLLKSEVLECIKIIPKANGRMKIPRNIYKSLESIVGKKFHSVPNVNKFDNPPTEEEFIERIIEINMKNNEIFNIFLRK